MCGGIVGDYFPEWTRQSGSIAARTRTTHLGWGKEECDGEARSDYA
ncbi:hypothetical protein GGI1_18053 [Acidithiobacillus sp. GGI-221]|nr:hypothetical protein GGI1_18053 [Acidithiobacillus sp. GGI-221]